MGTALKIEIYEREADIGTSIANCFVTGLLVRFSHWCVCHILRRRISLQYQLRKQHTVPQIVFFLARDFKPHH